MSLRSSERLSEPTDWSPCSAPAVSARPGWRCGLPRDRSRAPTPTVLAGRARAPAGPGPDRRHRPGRARAARQRPGGTRSSGWRPPARPRDPAGARQLRARQRRRAALVGRAARRLPEGAGAGDQPAHARGRSGSTCSPGRAPAGADRRPGGGVARRAAALRRGPTVRGAGHGEPGRRSGSRAANQAPLAELVRRLDGVPLAIELASVRVRVAAARSRSSTGSPTGSPAHPGRPRGHGRGSRRCGP